MTASGKLGLRRSQARIRLMLPCEPRMIGQRTELHRLNRMHS